MQLINSEYKKSLLFLLKWFFIAILAGIIAPLLLVLFRFVLDSLFILWNSSKIPLPVIPVIGAVAAGAVIYRISPEATGEGIPSYISALKHDNGVLDGKVTVFKFIAALIRIRTAVDW